MGYAHLALWLSLFCVVTSAQAPVPGPPAHPLLVKGLVKHAPAGMRNPNDLGTSTPIASLPDASADEQALTDKAFEYANQVVAAPRFRTAVLQMEIPGCYQRNYYEPQFRFSDQAVYDLMLAKSPFKLDVIWYDGEHPDGPGSNQGYEVTIFDNTIGANQNAVLQEDGPEKQAAFVASLILHESSHVSGFRHPVCLFHKMTRSVPYNMNSIYDLVAPQIGLPVPQY